MMNRFFLLSLLFGLFLVNLSYAQNIYYEAKMEYKDSNLKVKYVKPVIKLEDHDYTASNPKGFYSVKTFSKEGIISNMYFGVPDEIEYLTSTGGGTIKLNQIEFSIYIPHNNAFDKLIFYDPYGKAISKQDVSSFSTSSIYEPDKSKEKISDMNSEIKFNEYEQPKNGGFAAEGATEDLNENKPFKWSYVILPTIILIAIGIAISIKKFLAYRALKSQQSMMQRNYNYYNNPNYNYYRSRFNQSYRTRKK